MYRFSISQTKRENDCFKKWQVFTILPFLPTTHKKKWITLKTKTLRRLTFLLAFSSDTESHLTFTLAGTCFECLFLPLSLKSILPILISKTLPKWRLPFTMRGQTTYISCKFGTNKKTCLWIFQHYLYDFVCKCQAKRHLKNAYFIALLKISFLLYHKIKGLFFLWGLYRSWGISTFRKLKIKRSSQDVNRLKRKLK